MTYERSYDPRGYRALDDRWLAYIGVTNPVEAAEICRAYDESCAVIDYDSNAAIAQGCVETARFTSNRWVNAHNAAGIGIYDDGTPDTIWGPLPYGDATTGIQGQCDLLTDYYGDGSEPFGTLAPLGFGGMVLHYDELCDMDGVWAADENYSEAIVSVMNEAMPEGDEPVVTAQDVIAQGMTQVGHPRSDGFDSVNGDHPWAYWCLSYVDSCVRQCGLDVPIYPNAVTAGDSRQLTGGEAPPGAAVFLDQNFYWPDGHAALSIGGGWCLSTLTDGTGVGQMFLPPETVGYMGWAMYDGVSPVDVPDPGPPSWYEQPGNPNEGVGIGGGMLRYYNTIAQSLDPMVVLGYALANEEQALVDGTQRTIQRWERGVTIWQPENEFPWDVVMALTTSVIGPLDGAGQRSGSGHAAAPLPPEDPSPAASSRS